MPSSLEIVKIYIYFGNLWESIKPFPKKRNTPLKVCKNKHYISQTDHLNQYFLSYERLFLNHKIFWWGKNGCIKCLKYHNKFSQKDFQFTWKQKTECKC